MDRFSELLEKRKNLTATIQEEQELIELAQSMDEKELEKVDKSLLALSNKERLDSISSKLDEMIKLLQSK